MSELLNHLEYAKLLSFIYLSIVIITYIVYRFGKFDKWVRYMPGLLSILIGIYGLFRLIIDDFWTKGVGNMLIILIGISAGTVGLLFALILGILNKPKRSKTRN